MIANGFGPSSVQCACLKQGRAVGSCKTLKSRTMQHSSYEEIQSTVGTGQ